MVVEGKMVCIRFQVMTQEAEGHNISIYLFS